MLSPILGFLKSVFNSANVGSLPIVDGEIEVRRIDPNFDGLEVSPERYKWWQDHLMKTWAEIA